MSFQRRGAAWRRKLFLRTIALVLVHVAGSACAITTPVRQVSLHASDAFEKNIGQFDPSVSFRGVFAGFAAAIHNDGSLTAKVKQDGAYAADQNPIRISFSNSRHPEKLLPEQPSSYRTNYFRGGAQSIALIDVPHFERVQVPALYEGIDLIYHIAKGKLEFDFYVAPEGDPSAIRLKIDGADVVIDRRGDLSIGNFIKQRRPVAYQLEGDRKRIVQCEYRQLDDGEIAFNLGPYDRTKPIVIDPVVDYSSFLGGANSDAATGVRIAADGYLYVAGTTFSSDFPTSSALDSTLGGGSDVFVAKINPATGRAVYATYIGGSSTDSANAVAVDSNGNAYVVGIAGSRFPTTSGAYQTSTSGTPGFVVKLSSTGNVLLYSTFLNGTRPLAVEVDSQGQAVVTGSAGTAFSATAGALQTVYGGTTGAVDSTTQGDAFVSQLNATGTGVTFSTYLGGSGLDEARAVGVNATGQFVVAGVTSSVNFRSVSALQPALSGPSDGFITVLSPDGRTVIASTYLGGSDDDDIKGIAIDASNNILVTGQTSSGNFPTANPILSSGQLDLHYQYPGGAWGYSKGFLAKVSQSPFNLLFSTYLGAHVNCCDRGDSVAVDSLGDVYVIGSSRIDGWDAFAGIDPILNMNTVRSAAGSGNDVVFAAAYSRDGQQLRFQGYLAGCDVGLCKPTAISARAAGQVVAAGAVYGTWYPITAYNTKPVSSGFPDAFVMTLGFEPHPLELMVSKTNPVAGDVVRLTATSYTSGASGAVSFWDGATLLGTATAANGIAKLDVTLPVGVRRLTATLGQSTTPLVIVPVIPYSCC